MLPCDWSYRGVRNSCMGVFVVPSVGLVAPGPEYSVATTR